MFLNEEMNLLLACCQILLLFLRIERYQLLRFVLIRLRQVLCGLVPYRLFRLLILVLCHSQSRISLYLRLLPVIVKIVDFPLRSMSHWLIATIIWTMQVDKICFLVRWHQRIIHYYRVCSNCKRSRVHLPYLNCPASFLNKLTNKNCLF